MEKDINNDILEQAFASLEELGGKTSDINTSMPIENILNEIDKRYFELLEKVDEES